MNKTSGAGPIEYTAAAAMHRLQDKTAHAHALPPAACSPFYIHQQRINWRLYRSQQRHRFTRPVHQFNPQVIEFIPVHQSQITDLFWHQFTPGAHYCPHSGTTITHPMDHEQVQSGHDQISGNGKRTRFSPARIDSPRTIYTAPLSETLKPEMVDVYNHETHIRAIPLRTLLRFSRTARKAFPESGKLNPESLEFRPAGGAPSMGTETVATSETGPEGDASGSSSAIPDPLIVNGSTPPPKPLEGKKLILKMDGAENPPNETVEQALRWMMDNDNRREGDLLTPFVEASRSFVFDRLVVFYQAHILLDLIPAPKNILDTMRGRLLSKPPTVQTLSCLYRSVPLEDPMMDWAFHSYLRHKVQGHYSSREILEHIHFLERSGQRLTFRIECLVNERNQRLEEKRRSDRRRGKQPEEACSPADWSVNEPNMAPEVLSKIDELRNKKAELERERESAELQNKKVAEFQSCVERETRIAELQNAKVAELQDKVDVLQTAANVRRRRPRRKQQAAGRLKEEAKERAQSL